MYDNTEINATVYADEAPACKGMIDVEHGPVKHSVSEYVNGMAHTNGVESFWAALKWVYYGCPPHKREALEPLRSTIRGQEQSAVSEYRGSNTTHRGGHDRTQAAVQGVDSIVAAQFLALAEPETSVGPLVDFHEVDKETDVNSLNLNWREAYLIGNAPSPNPHYGVKRVLELARMLLRLKEYTAKPRPK